MKRRRAVEREFGRLKHEYGLGLYGSRSRVRQEELGGGVALVEVDEHGCVSCTGSAGGW